RTQEMSRAAHPRAPPHPPNTTPHGHATMSRYHSTQAPWRRRAVGAVGVDELLKVGARRFTEFYETSSSVSTTDQPSLLKADSRRRRRSTPHFPGCSRSRSTAATKSFTLIGLLWYASNPASVILCRSSDAVMAMM